LEAQPHEVIDRAQPVAFTWNGRSMRGFAGDTIVSALLANGVDVISRSFKYKRPRGVLSATFHDPNCTVQVDDEPNVRGAHRALEAGMAVRAQNVWPSLRFDVGAANGLIGRFLTAGFYYKTFIKPQRLWPAYRRVLGKFAAGGVVAPDAPSDAFDQRYLHVDVCVAGGGPCGIAAAIAAAETGARVLLVEEEYQLGGHLRYGGAADHAVLDALLARLAVVPGVEVLTNSVVTGRYDDNWLGVVQRRSALADRHVALERLCKVRAATLVVATGLIERPYVFEGNDLPGVLLSTAARRLVNLYSVRPGERAVVMAANSDGDACAADLERVGLDVHVVDARRGSRVVRASGRARVSRAELDDGTSIPCDLLVTAVGWTPAVPLLTMAGNRPVYDDVTSRFVPGPDLPASVFVTGGIAGDGTIDDLLAHADAVGRAAAATASGDEPPATPTLRRDPHPALFRSSTHGIVDYSEDVSSKDLVAAAAEGFDSIELVKRFTTVTMGPSQGKLESVNAVAVLAEAHGVADLNEIGTTVWRPPYVPITLGALAGRPHKNVRLSPMQTWHERRGAHPLIAGEWIRPDHYGDPAAEVRNARTAVGVIDVTPLGKLDLRGPDVPQLLNAMYVNKWSQLPIGGVRYGVMCGEDGVVLDDGVTARLGPDRYMMTTTTSGAATVWELAESVLQTEHPEWRVHVTPMTSAFASINVAGPNSRELLGRVVEGVDLAGDAFPYMTVREGTVAGVARCFMWRIGFTGELSYEIHVPASFGLHVWEALFAAGGDLGIAPFGVEAQRIMRLEKGHFIVGQDTDALTSAYSAGLGGLVKLDKAAFSGRTELAWDQRRDDEYRLVALQPIDPSVVPPEASQLVSGAKQIVGRVTSSRMSPTLERSICLGLIDGRLARPGSVVTCQLPDRRRVELRVMEHHAHYDPEGTRLRS
jgi:sarcosine oxidase subunit alpha